MDKEDGKPHKKLRWVFLGVKTAAELGIPSEGWRKEWVTLPDGRRELCWVRNIPRSEKTKKT